jgi:hypothetical protein
VLPALYLREEDRDLDHLPRSSGGVLLLSSRETWNDDHPYPSGGRVVPKYQPPDPEDPARGTADERRRGPFVLGVAFETELPKRWYSEGEKPKSARVAVIGQAGVFVDPVLSPARQKLLLDTCNWLIGREDLLDQPATPAVDREPGHPYEEAYPRVELSGESKQLWLWGTRLGLPALFAYLGLVTLLMRRMS